jgi:hypothetical protein
MMSAPALAIAAALVLVEDVGRGQHVLGGGLGDHVDLEPQPMPVSSRLARKVPSISPTVGKFCTPGKADPLQLVQEHVHQAERVGAQTPASTGVF